MRCVFCNADPGLIVLIPFRQPDGALESFSCLECAIAAGYYCVKHDRPHIGFLADTTTACISCIEEEVQNKKAAADALYERIKEALPPEELEQVKEAAEIPAALLQEDENVSILRFMVTRAHRWNVDIEEVLRLFIQHKTADIIVPPLLFGQPF